MLATVLRIATQATVARIDYQFEHFQRNLANQWGTSISQFYHVDVAESTHDS